MLNYIKHWFRKKLGWGEDANSSIREVIEELIEEEASQEESGLSDQETKMLSNVLKMRELNVEDVMVPRADMIAIHEAADYKEVMQSYQKTGFSRFPVYRDTLDDVIGCINVRDLLTLAPDFEGSDIKSLIKEVLFVPHSMHLIDLLIDMRATRIPMAIVVDEYGGVDGLVTAWNVLEELLGETDETESEEASSQVTHLSDGSSIVSARMELDDFENEFGKFLTDEERLEEENDTVGGLVMSLVGRVPTRKEIIKHPSGIEFEILEADPRRVIRVRVYNKMLKKHPEILND